MRLGIIGCGQMGGYYAANLVHKLVFPASDIVAYDIDAVKRQALASTFGTGLATRFPTGLDAAIVAVNTPAHAEVILRLLQNGVKYILCEKPLALTSKEVRRIRAAAGGARIYTAMVINFSGALEFLLQMMHETDTDPLELWGMWGKPRPLDKNVRPSAGNVEDEAIHPIAFAFHLVRHHVRWVTVTARVGALPFVAPDVQERARERDASFPERPSSSTAALMSFVSLPPEEDPLGTPFDLRSSFLLARQERKVGGIIGKHNFFMGQAHEPAYLFDVEFDLKERDRVVDVVTIVDLKNRETRTETFAGDKLRDVTGAFLDAARGNAPDWRLADLWQGALFVGINEAIVRSTSRGLAQRVNVESDGIA